MPEHSVDWDAVYRYGPPGTGQTDGYWVFAPVHDGDVELFQMGTILAGETGGVVRHRGRHLVGRGAPPPAAAELRRGGRAPRRRVPHRGREVPHAQPRRAAQGLPGGDARIRSTA